MDIFSEWCPDKNGNGLDQKKNVTSRTSLFSCIGCIFWWCVFCQLSILQPVVLSLTAQQNGSWEKFMSHLIGSLTFPQNSSFPNLNVLVRGQSTKEYSCDPYLVPIRISSLGYLPQYKRQCGQLFSFLLIAPAAFTAGLWRILSIFALLYKQTISLNQIWTSLRNRNKSANNCN